MLKRLKYFSLSDLAQQMVGGFLLAGPFVVTEEVWKLAYNIEWYHSLLATVLVISIGYGTLYNADEERDPDKEEDIAGIPIRFISLLFVSYLSVTTLIVIFGAKFTFEATLFTVMKVISIVSIFSVIGAATANTIF